MWTDRRRSWFMLIRVKTAGKRGFVFPLPLAVLEEAVDVLADLVLTGETLFPGWARRINRYAGGRRGAGMRFSPSEAVRQLGAAFSELRRHGRWQMVEVVDGKHKISVEFY